MARHEMAGRKLAKNVFAGGQWYGPSYPDAGDPPPGLITNPTAFVDAEQESSAPPMDVQVTVQDAEGVTREGTAKARHVTEPSAAPSPPKTAPAPEPEPEEVDGDEPPPLSGPGSGRARWAEYAAARGVTFPHDATREQIVEACQRAGAPTE